MSDIEVNSTTVLRWRATDPDRTFMEMRFGASMLATVRWDERASEWKFELRQYDGDTWHTWMRERGILMDLDGDRYLDAVNEAAAALLTHLLDYAGE